MKKLLRGVAVGLKKFANIKYLKQSLVLKGPVSERSPWNWELRDGREFGP